MQSFTRGNRGDEVVDIQIKLSKLGYNIGPSGADGSFGIATEMAVKEFQRDRGLAVSGRIDEGTWRALVEATYKLGDRLLYLRAPFFRGDDVRELQDYLNTLGFNTGQVNGVFDETTERAVREFQRNVGLQSDGIFGPSTRSAIQNLRHLLTDEVSCIFPDPHRDQPSAISVFQSRGIAIDPSLQGRVEGTVYTIDEASISKDLGMRLGNLLELLGARVFYVDKDEEVLSGDHPVEMCIGVGLNVSDDHSLCGSTTFYDNSSPGITIKSKALAAVVQEEVAKLLESEDLGIGPLSPRPTVGSRAPAILVKPLFITNPRENLLLSDEGFRQKVAVAIFDGIKNYLQFC